MLNEDKIKLMTSISMFEKREGKRIFPINRYFKGDYISNHVIRSFLSYTLCWGLGGLVWVLYNIESLFDSAMIQNLGSLLLWIGGLYGAGLILYLAVTIHIYSKQYNYANRAMKVYVAKLKRLGKRYEFQNKAKEMGKEGVKHDRTPGI